MRPNHATDCIAGIYKFTNKVNGKVYIGQSKNVYNRYFRHKEERGSSVFPCALRKYGFNSFDFKIIERIQAPTTEYLNEREQYWMDHYQSYNREMGYNFCPIAGSCKNTTVPWKNLEKMQKKNSEVGWRKGVKMSLAARLSMSEGGKKKTKQSDKQKQFLDRENGKENNAFYGKTHSEETKEEVSFWAKIRYDSGLLQHNQKLCVVKKDGVTYLIPGLYKAALFVHKDRQDLLNIMGEMESVKINGFLFRFATEEEIKSYCKEKLQAFRDNFFKHDLYWLLRFVALNMYGEDVLAI